VIEVDLLLVRTFPALKMFPLPARNGFSVAQQASSRGGTKVFRFTWVAGAEEEVLLLNYEGRGGVGIHVRGRGGMGLHKKIRTIFLRGQWPVGGGRLKQRDGGCNQAPDTSVDVTIWLPE
jgi:hypothetical protein